MTTDPDTGRPTRRFAIAVWVAILVPLVTAAIVIPTTIAASNQASGVRRTIDVALCSAQYTSAVDDAELDEDRAREKRERAFGDGLIAATQGDEAGTAAAVVRIKAASADVDTALTEREAALDALSDALTLAAEDPAAFLATCEE